MLAAEGGGLDWVRPEAGRQVKKLLQRARAVRFASVKNGARYLGARSTDGFRPQSSREDGMIPIC